MMEDNVSGAKSLGKMKLLSSTMSAVGGSQHVLWTRMLSDAPLPSRFLVMEVTNVSNGARDRCHDCLRVGLGLWVHNKSVRHLCFP